MLVIVTNVSICKYSKKIQKIVYFIIYFNVLEKISKKKSIVKKVC